MGESVSPADTAQAEVASAVLLITHDVLFGYGAEGTR